MRYRLITVLLLSLSSQLLFGQTDSNRMEWEQLLDYLTMGEELSEQMMESVVSELEFYYENPININKATPQELTELPFLSDWQIENIHAYLYMHGDMLSLGELQMVPGLDYNTRVLLSHFLYVAPSQNESRDGEKKRIFRDGKQQIMLSGNIPLYTRNGFKYHSPEELARYPNRAYLGSKYSHNIRYSLKWRNRVQFGITTDKDSGEPFFHKNCLGYDHISPYLSLSDIWGMKRVVIGNIRAHSASGLILGGGGFSMGKEYSLISMQRRGERLKPHTSTAEYGYFTGAGLTAPLGNLELTLMAAHTPIDATLRDSIISSYKQDGYHRTELEWEKRRNVALSTLFSSLSYQREGVRLGCNILFEHSSIPTKNGDNTLHAGIDYTIRRGVVLVCGETAIERSGAMATLNSLSMRLFREIDFTLCSRYYGYNYSAIHGNALSESGLSNEEGLLISLSSPSLGGRISAYIDWFNHPRPRYGVSIPSNGFDCNLNYQYSLNRDNTFICAMRYKVKQRDYKPQNSVHYRETFRGKMEWRSNLSQSIQLQTLFRYTLYHFPTSVFEHGLSLTEALSYNHKRGHALALSASIFNTDSYNSSVSIYERGILYGNNRVTMYGKGVRLNLFVKCALPYGVTFIAKVASDSYFDREQIGSLQQQIDASHKEDICLQLRYNF